ncbi:MAG: arginase family protein [Planctomycetes bacterium]|nr:arginase family protein [Planctomycetota bacterium]
MTAKKTLRLVMPQWQGADGGMAYPGKVYPLGARLLRFLAPDSDAPTVEVPVEPYSGLPRPIEDKVAWHRVVLKQARAARKIIDAHSPDRVIMFGGDCLVSLAPFAYLNERYGGAVGLLWIDSHPDITTPDAYEAAHTYVLGSLLGHGDPALAEEVRIPYRPEQVRLVGVHDMHDNEIETVGRLGLGIIPPEAVAGTSAPVTEWIGDNGFKQIAIHFDLDVLDRQSFRSQFHWNSIERVEVQAAEGRLGIQRFTELVRDVAAAADVVGFSFAEHLPWDAYHLQTMMASFPFMR